MKETERGMGGVPEFEDRANEFVELVRNISDRYPSIIVSPINFTKAKRDSSPDLIEWFRANGYEDMAIIENREQKEIEFDAKYKNVVDIYTAGNDHWVVEVFLREVRDLAVALGGEDGCEPLFTDWGENPADGYRFTSIKTYTFSEFSED